MAIHDVDAQAARHRSALLLGEAPDHRLPVTGTPAADAMRLGAEDLVLRMLADQLGAAMVLVQSYNVVRSGAEGRLHEVDRRRVERGTGC